MNETLITLGAIVAAVISAMIFTVWRIRRIQYPPELRWPTERERRRQAKRHRHRPADAHD